MKKIILLFFVLAVFPLTSSAIRIPHIRNIGHATDGGSDSARHAIHDAEESANSARHEVNEIADDSKSPLKESEDNPNGTKENGGNEINTNADHSTKKSNIIFFDFSNDKKYKSTQDAVNAEKPILVNKRGELIDKDGKIWNSMEMQYKEQATQLFLNLWDDLPKNSYSSPDELQKDLTTALQNDMNLQNKKKGKRKKYKFDKSSGLLDITLISKKRVPVTMRLNAYSIIKASAILAFSGVAGGISLEDTEDSKSHRSVSKNNPPNINKQNLKSTK